MKLYTSLGPNPAVVNAYLLERGQRLETVAVDIAGGESRKPPYLALNPSGTLPLLLLDDGTYLAESIAICEYLDETMPGSRYIGNTPEERAVTRMWLRRIDISIIQPCSSGWRFAEGLEWCRANMYVIPHAADDFKAIAALGIKWINDQMKDNAYICGDRFTLADMQLYIFLEFGNKSGQPIDPALAWIAAWRGRMAKRRFAAVLEGSMPGG